MALIIGILQTKGTANIMNALHIYSKSIEPDTNFEGQFNLFQMGKQCKYLGKRSIRAVDSNF